MSADTSFYSSPCSSFPSTTLSSSSSSLLLLLHFTSVFSNHLMINVGSCLVVPSVCVCMCSLFLSLIFSLCFSNLDSYSSLSFSLAHFLLYYQTSVSLVVLQRRRPFLRLPSLCPPPLLPPSLPPLLPSFHLSFLIDRSSFRLSPRPLVPVPPPSLMAPAARPP